MLVITTLQPCSCPDSDKSALSWFLEDTKESSYLFYRNKVLPSLQHSQMVHKKLYIYIYLVCIYIFTYSALPSGSI